MQKIQQVCGGVQCTEAFELSFRLLQAHQHNNSCWQGVLAFSRHRRPDHVLSYSEGRNKTQCESVETAIRKRGLLLAGAVGRHHNGSRVMFGSLRIRVGQRTLNSYWCMGGHGNFKFSHRLFKLCEYLEPVSRRFGPRLCAMTDLR